MVTPERYGWVQVTTSYKRLHALTNIDAHPIPRERHTPDSMHTGKALSIFNSNTAFRQDINDRDIMPLTAVRTPTHLFFEFLYLPMRLNW